MKKDFLLKPVWFYGVTQEIKGISRIASVQLADATKFAI